MCLGKDIKKVFIIVFILLFVRVQTFAAFRYHSTGGTTNTGTCETFDSPCDFTVAEITRVLVSGDTVLVDIGDTCIISTRLDISESNVTFGVYDKSVSGSQIYANDYLAISSKPTFDGNALQLENSLRITGNNVTVNNWAWIDVYHDTIDPYGTDTILVTSDSVILEYLFIANTGNEPIDFNQDSSNATVQWCIVTGAGIRTQKRGGGTRPAMINIRSQGSGMINLVRFNWVHDGWSEGIKAGDFTTVEYNIVQNTYSTGIYVGGGDNNTIVRYNLVMGGEPDDFVNEHKNNNADPSFGWHGPGLRAVAESGALGSIDQIDFIGNIVVQRSAGISVGITNEAAITLDNVRVIGNTFIDNRNNFEIKDSSKIVNPDGLIVENNIFVVYDDTADSGASQTNCSGSNCDAADGWMRCRNNIVWGSRTDNPHNGFEDGFGPYETCDDTIFADPQLARSEWRRTNGGSYFLEGDGATILGLLQPSDFVPSEAGPANESGNDLGAAFNKILTAVQMDFFTVGSTNDPTTIDVQEVQQDNAWDMGAVKVGTGTSGGGMFGGVYSSDGVGGAYNPSGVVIGK